MAAQLTGAEFQALGPYQQQAYLNGDPNYLSAGPPAPTATEQEQATTTTLAMSQNMETIPFGNSLETVLTLDSFLSQWAAGAITFPGSLQGADPLTEAAAIAADRCKTIYTSDCNNQAALAAKYGAEVKAAIAAAPGVYAAATPASVTAAQPAAVPPAATAPATGVTPSATPAPAPASGAAAAAAAPTAKIAAAAIPVSTWAPHADFIAAGSTVGTVSGSVIDAATFGIGAAVEAVAGLFTTISIENQIDKLAQAVNGLRTAVEQGLDQTTRFAWSIANGLGALWRAIAEIWDNFLDALWSAIKSLWKALECVVSSVIPKIIQVLKNMRKYLDWIYQHIIRPIMNYLQKVRRILQILKLLHVPFAAKLDRIVGQIQSAVFGPFLMVLRWFNTYGSWINLILAADLTLQKPIFLRTMTKYQGDWINLWWSAQQNAVAPGANGSAAAPAVAPTVDQSVADFLNYTQGKPNDDTSQAQESAAAFVANDLPLIQ